MATSHISTQFDTELEEIRTLMLRMGGLVEEQLRDALAGFEARDAALLEIVEAKEDEVNVLELDLDDRCTHVVARRQPAAGDLRMLMAVFKTIADLERIGDEAVKIARAALRVQSRGASVPDGSTEFAFTAGGLNFHSASYQWLVVNNNGQNAQFKGGGTINGAGNYGFMIWAYDGAKNATPDTFRIQICDKNNGDAIVYDNGVNQALGGGNIMVHTPKK